ncbi:MAG TPA: type II toxin-antitoxin system RelE/ParE family toxin [Bacteroidales bacterium]|nr:type II toxin-antitoxin system RelE/ParE family toxin [Bacteroidales bacterium]HPE55383.1 type II toxin-antitoxin system RelE/ParE family toxin [Bacteroidales bacterium]HRX98329.1 type II toxin-antitoxin system RelE/ParE family toxin [Bacteroidales bacterium]
MANYKLTNKAVEYLIEISKYTVKQWSEKQADKYYEMLLGNFQKIAYNPRLGKSYEVIAPDLLELRVNRYIFFYRKSAENTIKITRILQE